MNKHTLINPTDVPANYPVRWYRGDTDGDGFVQWHWTYAHTEPRSLPNWIADDEHYIYDDAPFPLTARATFATCALLGWALPFVAAVSLAVIS